MTEEQIPHNWRWQRNCYFCVKNLVFSLEHMLFLPDGQNWVTTESINFRHRDWINRWKDLKSFAIFYQIPVEYETVSYPCVYFAGSASCGLNVHNIRHLVECVENWGPLWACMVVLWVWGNEWWNDEVCAWHQKYMFTGGCLFALSYITAKKAFFFTRWISCSVYSCQWP